MMKDIFPSTFSPFVQPVEYPLTSKCFKAIYCKSKKLNASEIFLEKDVIHFSPVSRWNEQLIKLFSRAGKDSDSPRNCHSREFKWQKVAKYLKRENIFKIKNIQDRICFRYRNTYLTTSYFTFGVRYVNRGTQHVYQTTNVPIIFYTLSSPSPRDFENLNMVRKDNCTFKAKDQYFYDSHILKPNREYKIRSGTYYLIVTTQSTCFSIDIIKSKILLPFSVRKISQNSKNINKKRYTCINSGRQLTSTSNNAHSSNDEYVCLYPEIDCPGEGKNKETPSKKHEISPQIMQPYLSPSCSCAVHTESFQSNAGKVENSDDKICTVSTISFETSPGAYGLLKEHEDNVLQLAQPEFVDLKKKSEQKKEQPTDYLLLTNEESTRPFDPSCKNQEVNFTDYPQAFPCLNEQPKSGLIPNLSNSSLFDEYFYKKWQALDCDGMLDFLDVCLYPEIDCPAEGKNKETSSKKHEIFPQIMQPYLSPSCSCAVHNESFQPNAVKVENSDYKICTISTISFETSPEANGLLKEHEDNVLQLAQPQFEQI